MYTPVHIVPKTGGAPIQKKGIAFTAPLTTSPRTRGQKERNRSNMAVAKCARENVLQDKHTRFVNTSFRSTFNAINHLRYLNPRSRVDFNGQP